MNKLLLVLIASAFVISFAVDTSSLSAEEQWERWLAKYPRYYGDQHNYRFNVFKNNLQRIKKYQAADPEAQYGVNHLADLTAEEFSAKYLSHMMTKNDLALHAKESREIYKPTITALPDSFDWTDKGAVTPVKNQGSCGSCWAFSAVQCLEGAYFVKTGELLNLSEEQLVECDKVNQGCNGGLMAEAFTEIKKLGGVELETDYPYTGRDSKTCKFDRTKAKVQVTKVLNISSDEVEIAKSLVELGPLAIAVDATPWQFYFGGISKPFMCKGGLNHGVLLVGFGTGRRLFSKNVDFWKIKNSWGAGWGEKGHIRLARGSGVCLMNQYVVSAEVEKATA